MPSARLLESIASSNFTALLSSADEDVPSVEEAVRDDRWLAAMNDEYESLERNKTWELVNLPPGRKAVSCMWLLKHKRDAHGNIVRFKARLVARGFTQVFGQDYLDTFAPVAKMSSFKVLLAISSALNLHLEHLDVKTAFLQGALEETIYMAQPPYFECKGAEKKVCKLQKSIYGLKQSPRCWYQKLNETLSSCGMKRTHADNCVYVLRRGGS